MLTSTSASIGCIICFFGILASHLYYRSTRSRLPPGPRPAPLIGNVLQIPSDHPEVRFAEWGSTYGDIVYITLFGKPTVILNTFEAAQDLMEKRSAIYSDRPRFVLLSELMGWHNASTHIRYGPRFRKHRRFIHQTFNQRATQRNLQPLQEQQALILVEGCILTPTLFDQHLKRYVVATIVKITYGVDVKSTHDPFVLLTAKAGKLTVESGTPAATLVDYFPLMRYVPTWAPFSGFKRNAREVKEAVDDMMNVPFNKVKANMGTGTAGPSLTRSLLESRPKMNGEAIAPEDEEDIKGVAGTLLSAAQDTTVAVLTSFVLAMVLHPEVLGKVQEEMDRVIGSERLPSIKDRALLPYMECVLKEVHRWNPPVPLGLPHRVMEDDIYQGYHIPKGSSVIANIYAMLKNCPEPDAFRPERFMEANDIPDPFEVVYGFGRRKCPGRHYADSSVWIAATTMVAVLQISKVKDEKGVEITPVAQFSTGFVRHPEPFPCNISPRSVGAMELIRRASVCSEL